MNVVLYGRRGKVGRALEPAIVADSHKVVEDLSEADAVVDFTTPDAVVANVLAALDAGVACVIGTTGADLEPVHERSLALNLPVFFAPNFAIGAVLMMRFAAQAAAFMPRVEIVELHNEAKKDAPSGTARATAELIPGEVPIHSVRLPGLIAHQEVLLGGEGQLLTIRHDTLAREAYAPGVLLALDRVRSLPPGLTVGLDALL